MIAALLVAASWFPPFWVGPQVPYYNTVHITEWAATPTEGRMRCLDDLSYYPRGTADCRVEPDISAPDVTAPGWASR